MDLKTGFFLISRAHTCAYVQNMGLKSLVLLEQPPPMLG